MKFINLTTQEGSEKLFVIANHIVALSPRHNNDGDETGCHVYVSGKDESFYVNEKSETILLQIAPKQMREIEEAANYARRMADPLSPENMAQPMLPISSTRERK